MKIISDIGTLLLMICGIISMLALAAMVLYFWWLIPFAFFLFLPALLIMPADNRSKRYKKGK